MCGCVFVCPCGWVSVSMGVPVYVGLCVCMGGMPVCVDACVYVCVWVACEGEVLLCVPCVGGACVYMQVPG